MEDSVKDYISKNQISKYYGYHQNSVNKTKIEFGWKFVDESYFKNCNSVVSVLSVTDDISKNNITPLKDSLLFFEKLTSLNPSDFISKWKDHEKELKTFWMNTYPKSKEDVSIFMLNLAELLKDKKSFEMYDCKYEVIDFK